MFAKGANYIPSDAMLPNVNSERYERLFRDIKEANMNMIRVWGGGVYEDDRFYDLADENGILVWQDFMFACTTYPADNTFLQRVTEEAEYNIKRLRNHACLAMWCGNNEIQEGIKFWGWKKRFGEEIHSRFQIDYDKLFHECLPALVEKYDGGRFYMHTSPYFANWGRPDTWKVRDSHNWGIWYGKKPFESADEEWCRFASEYGFQSFPEMKKETEIKQTNRIKPIEKDYRIEISSGSNELSISKFYVISDESSCKKEIETSVLAKLIKNRIKDFMPKDYDYSLIVDKSTFIEDDYLEIYLNSKDKKYQKSEIEKRINNSIKSLINNPITPTEFEKAKKETAEELSTFYRDSFNRAAILMQNYSDGVANISKTNKFLNEITLDEITKFAKKHLSKPSSTEIKE